MTTIAYRDGVMAADSQGTNNGLHAADRTKVYDINGWLLGGCGASSQLDEYLAWFRDSCKDGKLRKAPDYLQTSGDNGYTVLLVNKKTRAMYQVADGLWPFRIKGKYAATGSGMSLALGAMAMGGTAKQAVQAAIKHDVYSSGSIKTKKCFPEKIGIKSLKHGKR